MYNDFSTVYDEFISDVDYDKWANYYFNIFKRYGHTPHLGLDLGCGTGNMTVRLCKKGIDMIGVDSSDDMLMIAREKSKDTKILYLNQDMQNFELYGTVDFIVSGLDCINYITDKRDLLKVFKLVNNYLDPGGLFIFDINTRYKLETILGNNNFVFENDRTFCSWQNEYDKKRNICNFYLTFFKKTGENYKKYTESQQERAYGIDEISLLIKKSGMKLLKVYDNLGFEVPKIDSERVFFVAQEQGKKK